MKKAWSWFLAVSLVLVVLPATPSSALSPGTKCPKSGAKQVYKNKIYTCIKQGSKLYWNNGVVFPIVKPNPTPTSTVIAAPTSSPASTPTPSESSPSSICDPSGTCKVGMIGPGGGIVFYDAGSQKSWGRYLEYAYEGWLGGGTEPTALWCVGIKSKSFSSLGLEMIIGSGKSNTKKLFENGCTGGAIGVAYKFEARGLADWYLPAFTELRELCKFAHSIKTGDDLGCDWKNQAGVQAKGFTLGEYWSSSIYSESMPWAYRFSSGNWYRANSSQEFYFRAIRAF